MKVPEYGSDLRGAELLVATRARQIFGEDFLGEEAVCVLEKKCRSKGIGVEFEIPQHTQIDLLSLENARRDQVSGKPRFVSLNPEWMIVQEDGKDIRKPVDIINLRALFKREGDGTISYDNNPFGSGEVFDKQDWYDTKDFAKQQLRARYSFPTKGIIPGSVNKTWIDQCALFEPGERRREAVEAVWETLLYYANTGKNIFDDNNWDWTNSQTPICSRVDIGSHGHGIHLSTWSLIMNDYNLGAYSSR